MKRDTLVEWALPALAAALLWRRASASRRDVSAGNGASLPVKAPRAWMYWTFNRRRRALLATTDGRGGFVLQTQLRKGEKVEDFDEAGAGRLFVQAVGRELPFKVTGVEPKRLP